jgi:hypothetical protein
VTTADEADKKARLERARETGLFRYSLVQELLEPGLSLCARSFKMRMLASLTVRMCGREEGPAGVSRRGLGVRGGVVVVSLP